MVTPEVILNLQEWLVDHPTVFCYSDSMLAASVPHGEAITQIMYGASPDVDGKTTGFIASNIQAELRAWQKTWLGPQRKLNSALEMSQGEPEKLTQPLPGSSGDVASYQPYYHRVLQSYERV